MNIQQNLLCPRTSLSLPTPALFSSDLSLLYSYKQSYTGHRASAHSLC